jgi:hypothetical protein
LLIFLLFGRSLLSFENDQREEKYLTQGARDEEVRGPTPPTLDQIRFACASSSEIGAQANYLSATSAPVVLRLY